MQLSNLLREDFVCSGWWLMTTIITGQSAVNKWTAELSKWDIHIKLSSLPTMINNHDGKGLEEVLEGGCEGVL